MQVCTSLQTDNHASTPPLSFLQAGCPPNQQRQCTEGIVATLQLQLKLNHKELAISLHDEWYGEPTWKEWQAACRSVHKPSSSLSLLSDNPTRTFPDTEHRRLWSVPIYTLAWTGVYNLPGVTAWQWLETEPVRPHLLLAKGKGKGSPYSITERRVPELIPVLGSQPAGDVSHKPAPVGCLYFPPGPQLPSQPLRGLLPILLIGEQRHSGCEQFA